MRILMTESLATVGGSFTAGKEYEFEDAEAHRLIRGRIAIATDPTFVLPPPPVPAENVAAAAELIDTASALLAEQGEAPNVPPVALPSSLPTAPNVPPVALPSSLPTEVTPNAGGIPPLGEPDRPTTLPSSLDPLHTAERELKAAEDFNPTMYGHVLSDLASKSNHELLDMPLIGNRAIEKIRAAQAERDEKIAAARARLDELLALTPEAVASAVNN